MPKALFLVPTQDDRSAVPGSFIGGLPHLPTDLGLPACKLCRAPQTFFFQVALPSTHPWAGWSVALFACTSCAQEDSLIPAMLPDTLRGAVVSREFIDKYRTNFQYFAFPSASAVERSDYRERISRKALAARSKNEAGAVFRFGTARWLMDDEAPASYARSALDRLWRSRQAPFEFLFQLRAGTQFEILEDAPAQMDLNLKGEPKPSDERCYRLFLGNESYFFGARKDGETAIYILTQVD